MALNPVCLHGRMPLWVLVTVLSFIPAAFMGSPKHLSSFCSKAQTATIIEGLSIASVDLVQEEKAYEHLKTRK